MTIHPAFMKAAGYFDVKIVTVPLTKDYRPDLAQYEMVWFCVSVVLSIMPARM